MTTILERPTPTRSPERRQRVSPLPRWPGGRPRLPRPGALFCGVATALVVAVQSWNIAGFPMITDDEGTYLSQAWAVQHGHGLAHYTYWYDHPPGGWIQIALLSWLPPEIVPGLPAVAAARMLMPVVTAISCVLLYLVARRLGFARWAGALAVLVFGLSPLAVTLQRQLYLDNFAVPWMLGACLLALSRRRHLWLHVAAGGAAAVGILSKETILLVLPTVIVLLWQSSSPSTRSFSFAGFFSGVALVGAVYPLYATLKGELFPGPGHVSLIGAVLFQVHDRGGSGSMLTPGSGANQLLHSWLYYDHVLILGGVAATVLALAVRRLRGPALAVVLLTLMALRPNGYLPAMYVIQALPFLALALVGVLEVVVRLALGRPLENSPATWSPPRRDRREALRHAWWRIRDRVRPPRVPAIPGAALALREPPATDGPVPMGRRVARATRLAAVVLAVAALLGALGTTWSVGIRRALTTDDNASYTATARWIGTNVPDRAHQTIVVDDALWLDMVHAGFARSDVVWFYKLDLDPEVLRKKAGTVDYIVSTPIVRQNESSLPTVRTLLHRSTVIATFGSGDDRIEIRQIKPEKP